MKLKLSGSWQAKVRIFGIDLWNRKGTINKTVTLGKTEVKVPVGPLLLVIGKGPTAKDVQIDAYAGIGKVGSKLIRSGLKDQVFYAEWKGGEIRVKAEVI